LNSIEFSRIVRREIKNGLDLNQIKGDKSKILLTTIILFIWGKENVPSKREEHKDVFNILSGFLIIKKQFPSFPYQKPNKPELKWREDGLNFWPVTRCIHQVIKEA